jgi:MoxR-like ATPase
MTDDNHFRLYEGNGTNIAQRELKLPSFERVVGLDEPQNYVADKGLRNAVNVAIALGQPLLVTGEPGTGKTQLARSVAYELALPSPLVFHTKTTSTARDLFYRYDSMRHFHDAQFSKGDLSVENYITFEALGLAILLSMNPEEANPYLPEHLRDQGPTRSVVLIDEIDKAPRDLPNDVLNEIENLSFTVTETGRTFSAMQDYRPILILTSNSEKNLPDAFLRRCIFNHISFPDKEGLKEIISRRLHLDPRFTLEMLDRAIEYFMKVRDLPLKKKPATAELLAWIRILEKMRLDVSRLSPSDADTLALSYSILAKNKEDKDIILQHLHDDL